MFMHDSLIQFFPKFFEKQLFFSAKFCNSIGRKVPSIARNVQTYLQFSTFSPFLLHEERVNR